MLQGAPWLPPSRTIWRGLVPNPKPTWPCQDALPRFFLVPAPSAGCFSPHPSSDRAVRLPEGLWPAHSRIVPTAAAHRATESCLILNPIDEGRRACSADPRRAQARGSKRDRHALRTCSSCAVCPAISASTPVLTSLPYPYRPGSWSSVGETTTTAPARLARRSPTDSAGQATRGAQTKPARILNLDHRSGIDQMYEPVSTSHFFVRSILPLSAQEEVRYFAP